jgi:outer membrane protein assembly factor BamB
LAPASEKIYASVTLVDGKLYYVSRNNGTYVLKAGPTFKLVAHNQFTSDTSVFNGSPAIADGRIYLRSDRALYCVAAK